MINNILGITGVVVIIGVFFFWNLAEKNYRKETDEKRNSL